MVQRCDLTLIPNQEKLSRPVFESDEAYEEFRRSFYEEIKDKLKELDDARRRSNEEAMRRWVD